MSELHCRRFPNEGDLLAAIAFYDPFQPVADWNDGGWYPYQHGGFTSYTFWRNGELWQRTLGREVSLDVLAPHQTARLKMEMALTETEARQKTRQILDRPIYQPAPIGRKRMPQIKARTRFDKPSGHGYDCNCGACCVWRATRD